MIALLGDRQGERARVLVRAQDVREEGPIGAQHVRGSVACEALEFGVGEDDALVFAEFRDRERNGHLVKDLGEVLAPKDLG